MLTPVDRHALSGGSGCHIEAIVTSYCRPCCSSEILVIATRAPVGRVAGARLSGPIEGASRG